MEKMYKYLFGGVVLLVLVISCTKEINDDVILFFKVEFAETSLDAFLEIPKETNFEISKGDQSVNSGDYQIKYNITEGSGVYLLNSIAIEENEYVDLPAGPQFTIEYVASVIGLNNITITIKDREKNTEEEIDLVYNVTDTAFTFDVVPSSPTTLGGGVLDLDISIEEMSPAAYDVKYIFLRKDENDMDFFGSGRILIDGDVAEPDTVRVLQAGDVSWQFEGISAGPVGILFTATSSLGITIEKTIKLGIGPGPIITFTSTPAVLSEEVNTPVNINFELTEVLSRFSYTMMYTASNEGVFMYNGVEYQAGDEIPIELGASVGEYTGTQEGEHSLEFTVTNSSDNSTIPLVSVVSELTIMYEGDTIAPVIELNGADEITINVGDVYIDPGAIATDNVDGDITSQIIVDGSVDVNVEGSYVLTYTVSDSSNNIASATRTVNVVNDSSPIITLIGDNPLVVEFGVEFVDPGATANDDMDGDISSQIQVTGIVDVNTLGEYTLTYAVTDSSGNETQVTRTVRVDDSIAPVITLVGTNPFMVDIGSAFVDPGATATDNVNGDLTNDIQVSGTVDINTLGDYIITYAVTDASGNTASVTRTVIVQDTIAPIISLLGSSTITISIGETFTDPGATALDNVDGDLTNSIVFSGSVNINVQGTYTVFYDVTDAAGNAAVQVSRTIFVVSSVSFNRATGVLSAPSGSLVVVTMNSGGSGSGNAIISVQNATGDILGTGFTCFGSPDQCLSNPGGGSSNDSDDFSFTMPANGMVNFTGTHSGGGSSGTSFTITVGGETFSNSMNSSNPIPQ
ncbi:DUF5011 domain-containing protein [Aquimarina sp. RZ0]|nr:DUF5011 domain-containing protein [Aquimarina sp. RZ0]